MNSLLLLNGSPRGERSNSMKMLTRVAEGWQRGGGSPPEVLHLPRRAQFQLAVEAFATADTVLLGTPLYTDAMPALVKAYIEALAPRVAVAKAGGTNPTLAFLVQSGFPEARTPVRWSDTSRNWRVGSVPAMRAPSFTATARPCR